MTDKEKITEKDKDIQEKMLSAKELTKRAASRFAFHLKSFGIGLATSALYAVFPLSIVDLPTYTTFSKVVVGMLTYFSLLLLFPINKNRNATALGLLAGLGSILAGVWALAPASAGLAAFIINAANRWKLSGGSIFAVIMVLVGLGSSGRPLVELLPYWSMALFAGIVAFGIAKPKVVPTFIDRFLEKRKEKKQREIEREKLLLEESQPQDPVEIAINSKTHERLLQEINQLKSQLSVQMCESINTINEKTQAILQCMRDDQRDIAPGNKFLERYLPMIATSIDGFARLASHKVESAEFQQAQEQVTQTLAAMADAFSEMHQHLLNDNVDDLMIDLKVMNQLIKIEGHKVPVEVHANQP